MAKNKLKIKRVNYKFDQNSNPIASGFVLECGSSTDVDPFVGGEFIGAPEFSSQKEENEWYENQVGKTLFFDELVTVAIATTGKTYIV